MAYSKIDELLTEGSSRTGSAEITAAAEIYSQQIEQHPINTPEFNTTEQEQRLDELKSVVMDKAAQLMSYAKINELPELVRQAFSTMGADLVVKAVNGTQEQLAAVPDINNLTDTIFENTSLPEQNKINEEAQAKIKALPIVAKVTSEEGHLFSRNWLSLSLTAAAMLTGIGLILLATGMVAPLGIVLTGATFIAVLAGAVSAAALAIGLGVKIGYDEWQRRQQLLADKQSYDEYNDQLRRIEEEQSSKLEALNTRVERYRELVAEHQPEDPDEELLANKYQSFNQEPSQDDDEFFSCDEGSDTESNTEEDHVDAEPPPADQCPLAFLEQELTNANEHMQQADSIDVKIPEPEPEPEPKSQNIEDSDARCLNHK